MNDTKTYSYARNQLYDLKLQLLAIQRDKTPLHTSQQWKQAISVLLSVQEAFCEGFLAGDVVEVVINRYTPMALQGFDPPSPLERLNDELSRDTNNVQDHERRERLEDWRSINFPD